MINPGIFKNLIYSEPWYNLEPYNIQNPGIFRIVECSAPWHIQNASIFRTLVYSKPWYNQNPVIFRTLTYLETCSQAYLQPYQTSSIECFKKITEFFLALFSNIGNCDLSETGRKKVELVFNIRKRDRFNKKSFFR